MTISKRGDAYHSRFRYTCPVTGLKKRFSRTCGRCTKGEAKKLEARWRLELERPPVVKTQMKTATMTAFEAHWLRTIRATLKPSTFRGYERACRLYIVPWFGSQDIRHIGPEDVAELQSSIASGRSPKTVNNTVGVLSTMMTAAVHWGYADGNPCEGIRPVPSAPQSFDWYTQRETDTFLSHVMCHRPQWHAFFAMALWTGMRQGEQTALQWGDLDLNGGRVTIRRAYTEGKLGTPKNGRARTLQMPKALVEVLRQHPRTLRSELVFPSSTGRYATNNLYTSRLRMMSKLCPLRRIKWHELRHSYASQLATAGVPIAVIQQLMGHSDLKTTMRYAHLCPATVDGYVERLTMRETG